MSFSTQLEAVFLAHAHRMDEEVMHRTVLAQLEVKFGKIGGDVRKKLMLPILKQKQSG